MAEERKRIPAEKYNKDTAPFGKKVAAGKDIYEWVDGNGEARKKNMKEYVNSFAAQVDYKAMIEKGYDIANGEGGFNEGIVDYTSVQGDTADIIDLVNIIGSLSQEQMAYLLQQSQEAATSTTEGGQTTGETTTTSTEETSTSGSSTTTTTEGGTT